MGEESPRYIKKLCATGARVCACACDDTASTVVNAVCMHDAGKAYVKKTGRGACLSRMSQERLTRFGKMVALFPLPSQKMVAFSLCFLQFFARRLEFSTSTAEFSKRRVDFCWLKGCFFRHNVSQGRGALRFFRKGCKS